MIKIMTAKKRIGNIKPGQEFIRVSGKHYLPVHAAAKREGISVQEWVRSMVQTIIDRRKSALRAGLTEQGGRA